MFYLGMKKEISPPPYVLISISSLPIFTSLRELLVHVFALLIWFSEKAIALF